MTKENDSILTFIEVVKLIQNKKINFKDLPKRFKKNKELALEAIKVNVSNIQYVSDELRNDKSLAMIVLKQNGLMIDLFSQQLQNDYELIILALSNSWEALELLDNEARNNKEFVLIALKTHGNPEYYKPFSDNIRDYIGEDLNREIGENDPLTYLTRLKLYNDFDEKISIKNDAITNKEKLSLPKI